MPDWLQAVLQYGSGPVIAAGALLWQQQRTDKRERERRAEEKVERDADRHQLQAASTDEHRRHLSERWRDDRRAVHTSLLTVLQGASRLVGELHTDYALVGVVISAHKEQLNRIVDHEVYGALSSVNLLASQEAREMATRAVTALHTARLSTFGLKEDIGMEHSDEKEAKLREADARLRRAVATYLDAARRDIETD